MVLCSHLFQNFPLFVVIHTVKGFSAAEAEADVFSGTALPCPILTEWEVRAAALVCGTLPSDGARAARQLVIFRSPSLMG